MSKTTRIWTSDKVMFYACDKHGLSGESQRDYQDKSREYRLPSDEAEIVRALVAKGYVEARVRTIQVPETKGTGFLDCPAHVCTNTTYHATPAGRDAWLAGSLS